MYRRDASRHRKRKTTPAFGHPSKKEGNLQHRIFSTILQWISIRYSVGKTYWLKNRPLISVRYFRETMPPKPFAIQLYIFKGRHVGLSQR
jgi:hypothetical protein